MVEATGASQPLGASNQGRNFLLWRVCLDILPHRRRYKCLFRKRFAIEDWRLRICDCVALHPTVMVMAAMLAACSAPTDMADLAGTYVMTLGADTLRLDASGRYSRVNGGSVDRGRWTVSANGHRVVLHDLPRRWPEHGRYDPGQGWHVPDTTVRQAVTLTIGTTWTGRIALGVQPEIGWRYLRIGRD